MSVAPPAQPIEPITPITFGEIQGNQPAVQPDPIQNQAPAQDQPAPDAKPVVDEPKASLEGIFGAPNPPPAEPAATDTAPPADNEDKSLPAKLRAELAEARKAARQAEDEWRQKYEEATAAAKQTEESLEMFRREMAVTDPTLAPEVVEATGLLTRSIDQIGRTLPPTVARAFMKNARTHVDAYSQLGDINDPGYDKRHEELSRALARDFGAHGDEVMRRLPELNEMADKVKLAVKSASSSSGEQLTQRARQTHENSAKMFSAVVEGSLSYNEELAKADPMNVRNIVANLIRQVPEFAETSKQITEYLRSGLVVPAPLSPEAEIGLTPEQKRAALAAQSQNFTQTSQNIYENTPLAFHAQAALPIVTDMYLKLKKDYDAIVGSSPSPSNASGRVDTAPQAEPQPLVNGIRPITMEEITTTR